MDGRGFFIIAVVLLLGSELAGFSSASEDDEAIITFEANIFGEAEKIIGISVPDEILLGNVSVGEKGTEKRIWINNTGNVDVTVTPRLQNVSEVIFSYLFFRPQMTSGGISVPHLRIGDFSFDISAPRSGEDSNDEDIYVLLDLTNFTALTNNVLRHRADVKFVAVEN